MKNIKTNIIILMIVVLVILHIEPPFTQALLGFYSSFHACDMHKTMGLKPWFLCTRCREENRPRVELEHQGV